jgi:hypothetical protein
MTHTFTLRPLSESEPPARLHPDPDAALFPLVLVEGNTPCAEPNSSEARLGSDVEEPTARPTAERA